MSALHLPTRLTGAQVDALFARQRERDPWGVRIHFVLALGAAFLAAFPTTWVEFGSLPVLACFFIRMTGQHPILEPLGFDRIARLTVLWCVWVAASLLWTAALPATTGDRSWLTEIGMLRWAGFVAVLYPVIDRRGWLMAALAAGLACAQVVQAGHVIGHVLHIPALDYGRAAGRFSGWWDPVVGGSVLVCALGLHLGAALAARTALVRAVAMILSSAALAGVFATGTRGAWIGAVLVIAAALALFAWRTRPRRRLLVPCAALAIICAAGLAIVWATVGHSLRQRLDAGIAEVRGALSTGDYSTDTGMRLAMWRWALIEARTHPLLGVGVGGFRPWAAQHPNGQTTADAPRAERAPLPQPHAHAHSWPLHVLATTGIVGAAIMLALIMASMYSGLRAEPSPAAAQHPGIWRGLASAYSLAPPLGIAGLAFAGAFDSITVNQQTACLLFFLIAMCVPSVPGRAAPDGEARS